VEVQALGLIADATASQEWAELLKDPLERATRRDSRGLAQELVEAGA